MYSKEEGSLLLKQFWTSFGQYLSPIPSSAGNKINWINYKTGNRFIHFKMDATKDHAYIGIEISHHDNATQKLFFSHFKTLRPDIEKTLAEKWIWEEGISVNAKNISRISKAMQHISIYRQEDWPQIISFLKTRIISLDRFWNDHKEVFEMLS